MLAIGKALMARPELLILDEPSLGLAPVIVEAIFETIGSIRERGMSVLMVEQHVEMTLDSWTMPISSRPAASWATAARMSSAGPPRPGRVSEPVMPCSSVVQSAVSGLLGGAMYGLIALGLALAFGVLKVLNVAHGELVMLGGYVTFFLVAVVGLDPFLSMPLVFAALFLVGVVLYLVLFRFVVRFDLEARIKNSLLISFGLVLILQALAVTLFTGDERAIVTDYTTFALQVESIRVPFIRLAGLFVAVMLAVGLQLLLERTTFGHAVKATSEDWSLAMLTGIDVRRVYLIAFALSAALAGVARDAHRARATASARASAWTGP